MTLVKLTYQAHDATTTEIVNTESKRFVEILAMDELPTIAQAPADAKPGVLTLSRSLNYTDADGNKKSVDIPYHVEDGNVVIDKFTPFELRGFKITLKRTNHGDMLSVNLGQAEFTLTERVQANDMINAIRRTQEFNSALLSDASVADDEDIDDEDIDDEPVAKDTKPVIKDEPTKADDKATKLNHKPTNAIRDAFKK